MGSPLPVTFLLMIVCKSTNPTVTLLQQHTGKPSVSISPSGEIVEGSSVTLTCSTDGNPPVESYIWYWTDGHFEGPERQSRTIRNETGQTYEIKNVNTGHSGGYRCLPLPGDSESNMVLLEVYYPPRNISVSISPSGERVEGSSVTLTCSSDANPPVKIYTWFKDKTEVASEKGQNYRITKISSKGRGEYKCTASNKYGTKDSPVVYMNVLYPPKSVSVSISPSGEIMEGSSVTLTCSSDANPPVKNYTWFKEGGTSPVGSGQNYCITNISIEERGRFYCKAQNVIGSQTSPAVSVLEPVHPTNINRAVTGLTICGGLVLLALFCLWFRWRQRNGPHKTVNICNPVGATATVSLHNSDPANQDNILYTCVSSQAAPLNAQASVFSTSGHTEYASIKFHHDTDGMKNSGNDILYASVQFHHPAVRTQLDMETAEVPSVIYSCVKQHK